MMAIRSKRSERRHSRRVDYRVAAFIVYDSDKAPCKVLNISTSGAFVETNRGLELGQAVELLISFAKGPTELSVTIPGKVARICGTGIGFASPYIDANQLRQLELMFECDKEDSRQFIADFCKLTAR